MTAHRAIASLTILLVLCASACGGDEPDEGSSLVPPAQTSASADPLVGIGEVELIDDGFGFTEGPQWMPDDGVLLFTDYFGDSIFQAAADGKITVFRTPGNLANGLAIDPEGRLITAESGARRITRTESDGTVTSIVDRFEGARLNQPNDIAVRSDGTIYFTDPTFGDVAADQAELDFHGVFRIAPSGELTAERRGDLTELPNGAALSPDESRLYVSNYAAASVWVFDVATDGSLSEAETFVATGEGPDGLAVDAAGNLFVATANGIEVFAPDGESWGTIAVPRTPANSAFGGADARTLYITAREGLYQVTLASPGIY